MSKRVVDIYNTKNSELYHEFSGMKKGFGEGLRFVVWAFFFSSKGIP